MRRAAAAIAATAMAVVVGGCALPWGGGEVRTLTFVNGTGTEVVGILVTEPERNGRGGRDLLRGARLADGARVTLRPRTAACRADLIYFTDESDEAMLLEDYDLCAGPLYTAPPWGPSREAQAAAKAEAEARARLEAEAASRAETERGEEVAREMRSDRAERRRREIDRGLPICPGDPRCRKK